MEKETTKSKRCRVPYRINPRRNMPRHILIKLTKTKNIISSKGKATSNIQGKHHTFNSWSLAETLQARRNGRIYLKY